MKRDKGYTCENRLETISEKELNKLKGMDRKIHFKLFMLWVTKNTYSKEKIAGYMGVSRQAFDKYIQPSFPIQPDIYKLFRLSKAMNIPLHYFTDDNIECMEHPENCAVPQSYEEHGDMVGEVNSCLINSNLQSENRQSNKGLKQLLEQVGLSSALMYRLTPTAKENLAAGIRELVEHTLSDKENLQAYDNPEYPAYMEEQTD